MNTDAGKKVTFMYLRYQQDQEALIGHGMQLQWARRETGTEFWSYMPGGDYFENLGVDRKIIFKGGLK